MSAQSNTSEKNTRNWFDGQDSAMERFRTVLDTVSDILPLPLESVRTPDPHQLADLSDKIAAADTIEDTIRLAHTLTSRELGLVFPLMAAISIRPAPDKKSARLARDLADKLHLIIRERACMSLYNSAWMTFQYHYPNEELAKALNILCQILEIKNNSKRPQDDTIRASETLKPIISDVASPTSRQFIPRLISHIAGNGGIYKFIQTYNIPPSLPFGNALITEAFLSNGTAIDQGSHKLFAAVLNQNDLEGQIELLQHFFNEKNVPEEIYNRFCQQIYKLFDDPAADHPIWMQVRPKTRKAFQDWVRSATIGSHCRHTPDKALLYLKYKTDILDVERYNQDTLLIHFPHFVIADSTRWPEHAVYYHQKARNNPFELANDGFNPNPADPAIPRKPVESAIHEHAFSETVDLPFDSQGIRLTGVFLDMLLSKDSIRPIRAIQKRLGG